MKKWLPWLLLVALVSIGAVSTYTFTYTGAQIAAFFDSINSWDSYTGLISGDGDGTYTEVDTAAELETAAGLGAFANEYLDDANQAAMQTTLGLGTGDSPTFTGATVTTLTINGISIVVQADCSVADDSTYQWCIDSTTNDYQLYHYTGAAWEAIGGVAAETDPIIGAITGLIICDGGGNCSAVVASDIISLIEGEDFAWTGEQDFSGVSAFSWPPPLTFADAATDYTTVGALWYNNDATGIDDGCFSWYDDDEVKYLIDVATLPTVSGQVPVYDSASDKHVPEFRNGIVTNSKSAAYTIGTDDAEECYDGTIYVTGAAVITACDNLTSQMSFTVVTVGAVAVSVDPQADDLIVMDGTAMDDGDAAYNTSTTGDTIYCRYYSADGWFCWTGSPDGDHWTDED